MSSRRKEQLWGLALLVFGSWAAYAYWQETFTQAGEHFTFFIQTVGPLFAVVGIALLLFPSYRLERTAKGEDINSLHGIGLLTLRWKIVIVVALIVELLYWYALGL